MNRGNAISGVIHVTLYERGPICMLWQVPAWSSHALAHPRPKVFDLGHRMPMLVR